jgi:hypothetical protein
MEDGHGDTGQESAGMGAAVGGRKRTVQVKFRVTEAERELIAEKMRLLHTDNLAAYLRKMAIDGYIIATDHADIKAMTVEIQKVGVNINQIAKRVNTYGSVYAEDMAKIQEVLYSRRQSIAQTADGRRQGHAPCDAESRTREAVKAQGFPQSGVRQTARAGTGIWCYQGQC